MSVFLRYYEYLWQRSKGGSFDALFQGMPPSLRADLSLSLYKPVIDRVQQELGMVQLSLTHVHILSPGSSVC